MGEGGEAGARTSGQRSTVLRGFEGEGKHPGWDLSLVSKSRSQDSFQPALGIALLTARDRTLSPGEEAWHQREYRLWGFHSTRLPW